MATGAGPQRMVVLGRLTAPWGVKGWLKAESYTDPPAGILDYPVWHLAGRHGDWDPVRVIDGRRHGAGRLVVVALEGVADPEGARRYAQRDVAVPRSALPPAGPGEYYWDDLPGCRVETPDGRALGTVSHLVETPAHGVMVVRGGAAGEEWIPLVPRHVKRVDAEARTIVVDWEPAEG